MTLQAHLGAASPSEHAALYRQAVALIELLQRRGAELESDRLPAVYRIAFDVEKLTWELDFFVQHFVEGYRGVALVAGPERGGARRGVGVDRRRARGRAARALPSRLSQPQPDAARRAASTSSTFRTRAWGPTPTTSCRCCATRTSTSPTASSTSSSRISSRSKATDAGEFRRRFDLMALQRNLKGARHVRLPDDDAAEPGLHPVHPAHAALRAHQPREVPALRAAARAARRARRGARWMFNLHSTRWRVRMVDDSACENVSSGCRRTSTTTSG